MAPEDEAELREADPDKVAKACMLCGDEAGVVEAVSGGKAPCGCSRGHAVCCVCLRQYVLHTHGLQVRTRVLGSEINHAIKFSCLASSSACSVAFLRA